MHKIQNNNKNINLKGTSRRKENGQTLQLQSLTGCLSRGVTNKLEEESFNGDKERAKAT